MLNHIITFHVTKWCRMIWYNIRYRIYPWEKIAGIYVPVSLKYGYSVLRFISNHQYECEELEIANKRISQNDILLELGTGIGFLAAYCAKKIGSERVHTYEANYLMKPVIGKLFNKNKVSPFSTIALLSSESSEGVFTAKKEFLASSEKDTNITGIQLKVPVLDINETIRTVQPTYLLMDIEGNEKEIFSIIDFQSIQKVQFELHPQFLGKADILNIFKKLEQNYFKKDTSVSTEKNYFFKRELPQSAQ